jgi:hypothetical protein
MRNVRTRAEFLRRRKGVLERKCLDCGRWMAENRDNYTTTHNKRKMAYSARCRACAREYRIAYGWENGRGQDGKSAPEPPPAPYPPALTWPTLMAWIK